MSTRTVTRIVRTKVKVKTNVEAWDTRNGANARLVTRDSKGRFVTNVSLAK